MIRFVLPVFVLFLFAAVSSAQQLKGVVTDEYGNPLPAVNVYIKNSTTGSTSGVDGQYRVEVKPGVYTFVFRILGYETIEKEIQISNTKPVELNISLKEESFLLNEAVIYADRRDIAKTVMKNAREARKFFLESLENYSCISYRKISLQREFWPNENDSTDLKNDSSALATDTVQTDSLSAEILPVIRNTSLRETYSVILSDLRQTKEIIIAENEYKAKAPYSTISVSIGGHSKSLQVDYLGKEWRDSYILVYDAVSARFDFLNPLIYATGLCEQPLLSPLAPTASMSYMFDFDGIFYENNRKIYKILVTPIFKGDALFNGHVMIEDSTWALRGVDLEINPTALLFCKQFRIKQNYISLNDSVIVPSKTEFIYTIKDGKSFVFGNITAFYKDYQCNRPLPPKTFGNEVIRYETDAFEKDTLWWDSVRPFPLTMEEQAFSDRIDSLQARYNSKAYVDSLDSTFNDINIWSFLIRGVGYRNRIKGYDLYFIPLVAQINPVGIGGYRHQLGGYYNKRFTNDAYMETESTIDYGFANKDIRGKAGFGLTYVPQKFVRTFVRFGDYYDMINDYASIRSIFSRSNYVRTKTLSIAQRMEIFNGLFGEITLTFSDQIPIRDMKLENWSNELFGDLNTPSDFEPYKKFDLRFELKYLPFQKYIMKGRQKIILESTWPEFSLVYRKGIPGIFQSEVNYDFLEVGITDQMKIARWGTSSWSMLAGSFVNTRNLRLIEHRYFRGSDLFFFSDPLQSFQLLDATLSSSSAYIRGNYMHHFEGAITNKIPLLNRLKISMAGGAGFLMMEENNFRHAEIFAGFERTFRIRKQLFRIGVFAVTADDNLNTARLTWKVGVNFYNPFTRKWDY